MPASTNINVSGAIERLEALVRTNEHKQSLVQIVNALFGGEDWSFLNVSIVLLTILRKAKAFDDAFAFVGADGQPITVGQTVYGEDGAAWEVIGVTYGSVEYPIVGRGSSGQRREMKTEWLTHSKPTLESTLSDFARDIAAEFGHEGDEASNRLVGKYAKKLNRIMNRSRDK